MKHTDAEHLTWIRDRLINVHGENPNSDYMIRLNEIIDKANKAWANLLVDTELAVYKWSLEQKYGKK